MGTVVVVGSINRDVTTRVRSIPAPGETVLGSDPVEAWGGKGANQAVAAARAGARVVMIGTVGDDDAGRGARDALERSGVDTAFVATTARATGTAFIAVDDAGENSIVVAPGANDEVVVPAALDLSATGADPVVLVSFEVPDHAVIDAASLARDHEARLVVNPAPARALPPAVSDAKPIVIPNRGELARLTGHHDVATGARALADQTSAPVVVTLGRDGALVVDGSSTTPVAAPVVDVVDTTGAGDAFCGTFAAALADGCDVDDAVRRAVTAGAEAVRHPGARH